MAKHWANPLKTLALSLIAAMTMVGCQAKEAAINLPAPSFSGPTIAQKPVAKPALTAPPKTAVGKATGPADWTPRAAARPWRWVVIHHSATPAGSMSEFDREHKAKGWDGVGYHFVIGNGTTTSDGQVEVTPRWPAQKWGAHAKTSDNRFNEYGIG
ncbi:MAG: N-acetylmuramoyl-L-alanine amidase, partial [Gemmatimonadaceae bacterium]|nr:N-acetylmuramoyl-L-alanine amidase [Gemmatimonadaceae bacterium]